MPIALLWDGLKKEKEMDRKTYSFGVLLLPITRTTCISERGDKITAYLMTAF